MTIRRDILMAQRLAYEAATGTLGFWWLSFADGTRPEGQQFMGVIVVQAVGMGTACALAHRLGCNPGGEVQGFRLPDRADPPAEYQNRLLTRAEAEELDAMFAERERS